MALQKQELSVTFTEGVDTKTDYKLSTKLDTLNNGYIGQQGTIKKRNGFDSLSTEIYHSTFFTGTNVAAGELLVTNKNEVLNVSSNYGLIYNSAVGNKWTTEYDYQIPSKQFQLKGETFRQTNIPGSPISFFREETATEEIFLSNFGSFYFTYTYGFYAISRRDKSTGVVREENPVSTNGWQYDNSTLLKVNNRIIQVVKDGNLIKAGDITTSSSVSFTTLANNATSATDFGQYNAFSINNYLFIVYVTRFSFVSTVTVKKFDSNFNLMGSISFTSADNVYYGFALECDQVTGNIILFYTVGPTAAPLDLYAKTFTSNLTSTVATTHLTNVGTNLGTGYGLGKTACWDDVSSQIVLFSESFNSSAHLQVNAYLFNAGTLTAGSFYTYSKLSSGCYFKDGEAIVTIAKETNEADPIYVNVLIGSYTGYISTASDTTTSLVGYDLCYGKPSNNIVPISNSKYGSLLLTIVSSSYNCSSPKEIINKGIFATGGIYEFCGSKIIEPFFVNAPRITAVTQSAGNVPIGNYEYRAVFEYVDAYGQLTESVPSRIFTVTVATTTKTNIFTIDEFAPSRRSGPYTVKVALYRRNTATETIFKFVSYELMDNSVTVDGNKNIYTTGNALKNTPPPLTNIFTVHGDRVFCVDEENKNTIFFTRKMQPGYGLRFNTLVNYFIVNDNKTGFNEVVTGLGSVDDKLIVFKNNSIYAVFGEGPNGVGQGSFSDPKLISTDIGCRDARSIVNSSEGLFFMSSKGIYLLDRSLQVFYIGADVEEYNAQEVTSAVLLPEINQIRFTTRANVALVYNYYYKAWSTFSNYEASHAVIWKGKYTHLKSNGIVNLENTGYLDNTTPIQIKIIQSWIKATGIQHLQRMWRMMFIGDWKSTHNVTVNLSYDYENYVWDTYTIVPLSSDYNRTDKPSLIELYNGANDGIYQYEIHLARQKCQSIRFELYDTDIVGESFSLTGLSFIIGVKSGLDKLTSNKKF